MLFLLQFIVIFIPVQLTELLLKNFFVLEAVTKIFIKNFLEVVFTVIVVPIYITGQTLLYFDLRIRKEAFDIEVMAENLGRLRRVETDEGEN